MSTKDPRDLEQEASSEHKGQKAKDEEKKEQQDSQTDTGGPGEGTGEEEESAVEEEKKTGREEEEKPAGTEAPGEEEKEEAEPGPEELMLLWKDKYMRLSADFDNYRKRTLKEKIDLTKTAGEELLIQLLPVKDDFERALKSMESVPDCNSLKEGIELIYNKFNGFLKQSGVKEIEALHQDFDTDVHEAVTKIPAPEKKLKGKVVDVIEKGYSLHEKVIRYAKVVVGE